MWRGRGVPHSPRCKAWAVTCPLAPTRVCCSKYKDEEAKFITNYDETKLVQFEATLEAKLAVCTRALTFQNLLRTRRWPPAVAVLDCMPCLSPVATPAGRPEAAASGEGEGRGDHREGEEGEGGTGRRDGRR